MRLGVAGKGGVGKSTVAALLSRSLARRGLADIAVDCDSDPNLAMNTGVDEATAAVMRPFLDQSDGRMLPANADPAALLRDYGFVGPDGVTLLLAARAEKAGSGWTGISHVPVRDFIAAVEDDRPGTWVAADMEAGLEHLSWAGGTLRHVDALLVVVEPGRVALLTAARTIALARELGIPDTALVANRVAADDDERRLQAFADDHGVSVLATVPLDPALAAADRRGVCVLDTDATAPGVRAVEGLADQLASRRR